MASKSGIDKERNDPEREIGHYRAYDSQGVVIWEQDDFRVGLDRIPWGLSVCMKACTIKQGNKVLHRWDPWGTLSK